MADVVLVLETPEADRVLSLGAVAGIVIGCVVVAVIFVVAAVSVYGANRRR